MLAKLFLVGGILGSGGLVHGAEISMAEFLASAWQQSSVRTAEQFKGDASDHFVSSARGGYFPHLSLEAIDTTGFPGSSSVLHVGGLMGSPFRKGVAGGVVLEQTIYDFGRIGSLLDRAKAERGVATAKLAAEKLGFLSELGGLYLECARVRSTERLNGRLAAWLKLILVETGRFTKTGQRSIVDNALVKTEVNDLELHERELQKSSQILARRMSAYSPIEICQPLSKSWKQPVSAELRVEDPVVLLTSAERELAASGLRNAKASQLPSLNVVGAAGEMDEVRLVTKETYSAGVGLVFPVWNGGEDWHREQAYQSEMEYQTDALKNARLEFEARMRSLREDYQRDQETLTELEKNLDEVRATMKLAAKRYRELQGPLIDVRETFQELYTMEVKRLSLLNSLAATSFQISIIR